MMIKRILLTNDDGIDAEGLSLLSDIAREIADDVWTVAPQTDQSGTSNALSLHDPLRVDERAPRTFAVSGSPSDCVVMGLRHFMKGTPPDLVLSGINRGANIGRETILSGTVGAAMTANLFGIKAIALSQFFIEGEVDWTVARSHAGQVVARLVKEVLPDTECLNVNFPACSLPEVKDMVYTHQGAGGFYDIDIEARQDAHHRAYHWVTAQFSGTNFESGSEGDALRRHHITVTPLQMDRTHVSALESLRRRALV